MKFLTYFSFLCVFLLCACPYEAEFYFKSQKKLDCRKDILGEWELIELGGESYPFPKSDDNLRFISIYNFNGKEYFIEFKKDVNYTEFIRYRAFFVDIGGESFLNIVPFMKKEKNRDNDLVFEVTEPDKINNDILFAKIEREKDLLIVNCVDAALFEGEVFENEQELAAFFKKNMKKKEFFHKESILKFKKYKNEKK